MKKSFILRKLFPIAAAIILTSCTSLEAMRTSIPKGDQFQLKLFELYKDFATQEAEQYDWLDSQHFINKAMLIVYGHNVTPEHPDDWKIPSEFKQHLLNYYDQISSLIQNPHLRKNFPDNLALAQFNYDCWLEEQEENWQSDDIAKCRDNFLQQLDFLNKHIKHSSKAIDDSHLKPSANKIAAKKTITPTAAPKKFNTQQQIINNAREFFQYRIFFEFDSDRLTEGAKESLDKIVEKIKKLNPQPEEIALNGFTDKAGNEDYNLKLSKKRAIAVKNYLANKHINSENIMIYAFGKTDGAYDQVAENAKEPGSRRVEIAIVD